MSPSKKRRHIKEERDTPGFNSSSKKNSAKKRSFKEDPEWCWIHEQVIVDGEPVKIPVNNLTKRLKKILRKSGRDLMLLDISKKKAHFHKEEMDEHLTNAVEASRNISDQMWMETESESSDTE